MAINISKGFDSIKEERIRYYKSYTYDRPFVMSIGTYEEMRKLGLVIHKAIHYMIEHYRDFLHLMPRDKRDLEILEICDDYAAEVGTFRTDFVIDINNQLKIIEMGTRHLLDGYFMSGFLNEIASIQSCELGIKDVVEVYPRFFSYLEKCTANAKRICVIKGNDKLEEMSFYPELFKESGLDVVIIPVEQISDNFHLLADSWVIGELIHSEIRSLSPEVIHALANCNFNNAIKSMITTHDKRFYYVLGQTEFTDQVLTASEKELLLRYLVPTWIPGKNLEQWEVAYHNKDGYILKHHLKGRSEDIYAGSMTNEQDWKILFDSGQINEMVLQRFIEQKKFIGTIGKEKRDDYVTGTLLYFNEEFFGPGIYRTSSLPVSNLSDFRKAGQLVAKAEEKIPGIYYL